MLFIFVEGPDDKLFLELFNNCFGENQFIPYASMKNDKIKKFIKAINRMPDGDYLFFGDADGDSIDNRRRKILEVFDCIDESKLFIVQYEIESWYYAGIPHAEYFSKLKMKKYEFRTESITKEQFVSRLPRSSEKAYMLARILEIFDMEIAKERNNSFEFFYNSIKEPALIAVS